MRLDIGTMTLAALLLPIGLGAQGVTTVWQLEVQIPDTIQGKAAGIPQVIGLQTTVATNGKFVGAQVSPSADLIASITKIDLTGARFIAYKPVDGDSIHVGMVMPPDVAAMMGGGIGFRFDFEIPDTLPFFPDDFDPDEFNADSIRQEMIKHFKETGQTETIAGIPCKVWHMEFDDMGESAADETFGMDFCLADSSPALLRLKQTYSGIFKKFTQQMKDRMKGQMKGIDFPFDTTMVPIKVTMESPVKLTYQLVSVSETAPDPSFFTLPDGLQPFPIAMVEGMMKARAAQGEADSTEQ